MSRLCELIGQYGMQCSETKELAPTVEFADELKRAEKDAARYRWLRDEPTGDQLAAIEEAFWDCPEAFDAAVDRCRDAGEPRK